MKVFTPKELALLNLGLELLERIGVKSVGGDLYEILYDGDASEAINADVQALRQKLKD